MQILTTLQDLKETNIPIENILTGIALRIAINLFDEAYGEPRPKEFEMNKEKEMTPIAEAKYNMKIPNAGTILADALQEALQGEYTIEGANEPKPQITKKEEMTVSELKEELRNNQTRSKDYREDIIRKLLTSEQTVNTDNTMRNGLIGHRQIHKDQKVSELQPENRQILEKLIDRI